MTTLAEANAYLEKFAAEKAAEEAAEVVTLTAEQVASERRFLMGWTKKATLPLNRAGGNFWMPGHNRSRCTILRPAMLLALVEAGVLVASGNSYVVVK